MTILFGLFFSRTAFLRPATIIVIPSAVLGVRNLLLRAAGESRFRAPLGKTNLGYRPRFAQNGKIIFE
jgi:hypothetical protein